jgi:hypothetical protein
LIWLCQPRSEGWQETVLRVSGEQEKWSQHRGSEFGGYRWFGVDEKVDLIAGRGEHSCVGAALGKDEQQRGAAATVGELAQRNRRAQPDGCPGQCGAHAVEVAVQILGRQDDDRGFAVATAEDALGKDFEQAHAVPSANDCDRHPVGKRPPCPVGCACDGVRIGLSLTASAGFELVFHGEYQEVVADERVVATELLDMPGMEPVQAGQEPVRAVSFDETDGKTTVRILTATKSKEMRDTIANFGMEDGMQEQMDRLEELLASDEIRV